MDSLTWIDWITWKSLKWSHANNVYHTIYYVLVDCVVKIVNVDVFDM